MKSFIAPIAVMHIPRQEDKCVSFTSYVLTSFTNNSKLSNPPVTLAVFGARFATYAAAVAAGPHAGKAATADRAAARKLVVDDLQLLKSYAQSVANTQTSAEDAVAVILSAGLQIKKVGKHIKPDLSAKNSAIPGAVLLAALALKKRGVWYFEYSSDQKTWVPVTDALKANATVTGLTTMQTYYFRYRKRTRLGLSDYSQIVSLFVM